MPFAASHDARLFYEDTGGDGPAVVLSHGLLMDHEMFAPQVAALRDRFRCVTWDERYHGRTEAQGPFSYWDSAGDVMALLDHLGIERAFLVGMSQGGFLSLRAAIAAPDRVAGLFLIDTQAGQEEPRLALVYLAFVEEWTQRGPQEHLAELAADIILGSADRGPWIEKWFRWPRENAGEMFRALTTRDDLSDRLDEITAPAVVVHGGDDAAIPVAKANALCDGLADCEELIVIPGAGHAPNLTHPAEVNAALERFLARHR